MRYKIDKIKHEDLVFSNYPTKCGLDDYNTLTSKIGKKFLTGNIKTIYTSGRISNPGISDIDFLIVVKNNTAPNLKLAWFTKKEQDIVCHPFYIIDENIMENIKWIYPDFNLTLIQGDYININRTKKSEINAIRIFLMLDVILRHFPRNYLEMLIPKWIDTRDALLRLNALNHSISSFRLIGLKGEKWTYYEKEIKKLRNMWFSIGKKEQKKSILKLLKDATYISMDMIDQLSLFLEREEIVKIFRGNKECVYNGWQNQTFFVEKWDKKKALKRMIDFYLHNKKFYSVLPLNFLPLFLEYSKEKGVLSSYIRRHLKNSNINYSIQNKGIIKKRINMLNRQTSLAIRMKHRHFTAFFDYGYKSKSGILNKGKHVLRMIKHSNMVKGTIFRLTKK